MKRYIVCEPYLDIEFEAFDTRAEAEEYIEGMEDWDRNHPQSYVPYYVVHSYHI